MCLSVQRYHKVTVVALALSCGACSTLKMPDAGDDVRLSLIEKRERLALAYESGGDYVRARTQWQVLKTLDPSNEAYDQRLSQLRKVIRKTVDQYFEQGRQLMAKGDQDAAAAYFINALALDGHHNAARQALRDMERSRMLERLDARAARLTRELEVAHAQADYGMAPAPDETVVSNGDKDASDECGQTRSGNDAGLSEHYYKKGIRVYRDDPDKAIEYWEMSLRCNAQHQNARLRLEAALRERENSPAP